MEEFPDHWASGAAALQSLNDDQFLDAWHECVASDNKERLTLIEGNARQRFPVGDWRAAFIGRYPGQTQYSLST